jgi:hypothetical protein
MSDTREFLLGLLPRGSIGAEIGVYKGDFAARIMETVKPKTLHLIDPWKYESSPIYKDSLYGGLQGESQTGMDLIHQSVVTRFAEELKRGTVRIHRTASALAAGEFSGGYFDWIYIDGNHQYEFVKSDLNGFYPQVRGGGIIAGDDYELEGWWKGGVKKAVDEFVATGLCDIVAVKANQYVLRKRA